MTIFDFLEEDTFSEEETGEKGFENLVKEVPIIPEDQSFFDRIADYGKTFLKGTAEGLGALGRTLGPTIEPKGTTQLLEEQTEVLDRLLPTNEDFFQRGLRRGLKMAPSAAAFPIGGGLQGLGRSIIAGFLGEGAKDLGAPEIAQTALELTAFIGPDVTKKLLTTGKSGELIKKGRELGLSDKQIAPLIQSEFKQKWLSKLSPRRGKTQEILSESKEGLSNAYEVLKGSKEGFGRTLSDSNLTNFQEKVGKILRDLPPQLEEKIRPALNKFNSRNPDVTALTNLHRDINFTFGPKSKQLQQLKAPIKEALSSISPQLASDFETVNQLYGKYAQIQKRLEPNLMTDLIGATKALQVMGGIAFGYMPLLAEVAGQQVASKLSQQMLLNPRFQQIGIKIADAVQKNKFPIAIKSIREL
ncbi:hypothetical protein, partial [Anaplasma marginale]|uniref:hypothetical protein n=1 Tax=Anaplasma marginale TaxID=770 RepID=UPI0005B3EA01